MKKMRPFLLLLALLMTPSWTFAQTNNYVIMDGQDDFVALYGNLYSYMPSSIGTVSMWIKPTGASPIMYNPWEGQGIFADGGGYMGINRGTLNGEDKIWFRNYSGYPNYYYHRYVGVTYNANEWTRILPGYWMELISEHTKTALLWTVLHRMLLITEAMALA